MLQMKKPFIILCHQRTVLGARTSKSLTLTYCVS